jgi:hypothetical protein
MYIYIYIFISSRVDPIGRQDRYDMEAAVADKNATFGLEFV